MRCLRQFLFVKETPRSVLLKGLQYYADDASKVGQTFVRLVECEDWLLLLIYSLQERDFDHHVQYCRDVQRAEAMLQKESVQQFFDVRMHLLLL